MEPHYIQFIREKVGHATIFLNAAAAIIEKEGEILAIRRGDTDVESWGLPGGIMEIGEGAEDAMRREVREETGLEVEVVRFQGVYTNRGIQIYPNGDKAQTIFFVFVCKPVEGSAAVDGEEIAEAKYVAASYPKLLARHPDVMADYLARREGVIR